MEDGCSKRFEVGMLDGSSDTYGLNARRDQEAKSSEMVPAGPPPLHPTMGLPRSMNMDYS
jgi:hypothetical protein